MAKCTSCGKEISCPEHAHQSVGQTKLPCELAKGVLWVQVVTERGDGVKGALVTAADKRDKPTDELGLASFGPLASGPYEVLLSATLPSSHATTHRVHGSEPCKAVVANGVIARVVFELVRRKPILEVVDRVDFGRVAVGERVRRNLKVANLGDAPLEIPGLTFPGEFPEAASNAVKVIHKIPEGGSAEIMIDFVPASRGARSGSLVIVSNDPERSRVTVELAGTGLQPVLEIVSVHTWAASVLVGAELLETVKVRNGGDADLVVSGITFPGLFPEAPTNTFKAARRLAPTETTDIVVVFRPDAGGSLSGDLVIQSNDAEGGGRKTVELKGTAIAPWKLLVRVTSTQRGADWPAGDIEVGLSTAADAHNPPERVWFHTQALTVPESGTFTVADAQTGAESKTLYAWARAVNGMWASAGDVAVALNPGDGSVTVTVNMVPRLIELFLDVNRDGVIDALPAANADWTWGPAGVGAILAVKSRNYAGASPVMERAPLELAWRGDLAGANWEATLAVDQPTRIKIYRGQAANANHLLGATIAGPLKLHADPAISGALDRVERVQLWMEAVDYPETDAEADWKVRITLTFGAAGGTAQSAMVRIAPWIMASDLDPSDQVYVRVTEGQTTTQEYALATEVSNFAAGICTLLPIEANKSSKGFARDVMKSGYCAAPHFSGLVIQGSLDVSPIAKLPGVAATARGGAVIKKPRIQDDQSPQDNGGNLMVSPPSPEYPWGRIVFGGDDSNFPCQSEAFYRAQAVQRPIRLDSTWLRVGHVDEMLSFVRGAGGEYYALLMSPRLGYIMLRGVASTRAFTDAAAVAAWAETVNNLCILDGEYTVGSLDNRLAGLVEPNRPVPNPFVEVDQVDAYAAAPPVPPDMNGFVIARVCDHNFLSHMKGQSVEETADEYPDILGGGRVCYEVRVQASRFLARADTDQRNNMAIVQVSLDRTRAILIGELGFTADRILEVPVILVAEAAYCVALTGDSVNLLQVAGSPASRCMVPKPFGPVYNDEYVYERYLSDKLTSMGVDAVIAADDKFHVMEGELHCGTNQTHPPLADDLRRWWNWIAP